MSNIEQSHITVVDKDYLSQGQRVVKVGDLVFPVGIEKNLSFVTAEAKDIRSGKVGVDWNGDRIDGTLIVPEGGGAFNLAKVTQYTPASPELTSVTSVEVSGIQDLIWSDDPESEDYEYNEYYSDANGTYNVTPETAGEADWRERVYKHESKEYYLYYHYFDDYPEESTWFIGEAVGEGFIRQYYEWDDDTDEPIPVGDLASGTFYWGDYDWEPSEVTLNVTTTVVPASPMVLKGVLADGYFAGEWSFDSTEKAFTGFDKEPKKNRVYAVSNNSLIGNYIVVIDDGNYFVINDEDTLILYYPPATNGEMVNAALGASRLLKEPAINGISVSDNKMVFDGKSYVEFPDNTFPAGVFGNGEWTMDVWYDINWDVRDTQIVFGRGESPRYDIFLRSSGKIEVGGGPVLCDAATPINSRRFTLEVWDNSGTLTWTSYINGAKQKEGRWDTSLRTAEMWLGGDPTSGTNRNIIGNLAHFSIRAKADHRGQSFEVTENPYA